MEQDDLLRPPPPPTEGTPFERAQKSAENMARYDAAVAAKREQERKDAAAAETEQFAEARLREWLDAGGSEEDFRAAWPQMFGEHLSARRAPADAERDDERQRLAERQRLIDQQRVF